MTTIMFRSALVFHGHPVPDDLAYVVINHSGKHVVTWAEVLKERRERQARILERKRHVERWRAVRLWVAYFAQTFFGGWHAFLEDRRGRDGRVWIDRDGQGYKPRLMELFPLTLPLGDEYERWQRWKIEFASRFERRRQCRKPVGVHCLWMRDRELRLPLAKPPWIPER